MNSTRQKRLFLLILTLLAGVCPAAYCADHEEPIFESNIGLPLQGERIEANDIMPNGRYADLLEGATFTAIIMSGTIVASRSLLPFLIKQATPWLPSIVRRDIPYINRSLGDVAVVSAFVLPLTYLAFNISREVGYISRNAIWENWDTLDEARMQHNRAVSIDPQYEGMIVADEQENRTLLVRHDNEVHNYPFDRWRQDRDHRARMMSGLVIKFLIGPGNLARRRAIKERLDALDNQLRPNIRNIKRSHR